jgi:hypothetical protein
LIKEQQALKSLKKRRIITLISAKQARKGFKFVFHTSSAQCENCGYYHVCIESLESGRVYQVTSLRKNIFPCPLHEEGVRVVEVVEAKALTAIPSKLAVEGATIVFKTQLCKEITCKNAVLCRPVGLVDGDKCIIVEVKGKLDCIEGSSLVKAKLRRISSDKFQ